MKFKILSIFLIIVGFGGVCFGTNNKTELVVMTHDSFSVSKRIIEQFEKKSDLQIKFLKAGDAGAALNQAILSKTNPLADLFYGIDNTYLTRALKADMFLSYDSPELQNIDKQYQLDPSNSLLPVDFGDVCLNYDKNWFKEKGINPPGNLDDLILPEYKNLTVVQNPATSSPGLAFLLATIGLYGEDGYLKYWKALRKNNVLVTNGWNSAYWGEFTAASKGKRPIVVSYASSPPATVYYSETTIKESPTAAVVSEGSAFRQIEFVGIFKKSKNIEAAKLFVDFMLGLKFQQDMPLQMFVFPVNKHAKLPEVFNDHAVIAAKPAWVDARAISENREKWIEQWAEIVIR
jgi:thiamine transport system substrate-binding protein